MKTMWAILVISFLSLPCESIADPSPEISALIAEKASMLDFGMYKLENLITESDQRFLKSSKHKPSIANLVSYDHRKNQIAINTRIANEGGPFKTREQAKALVSAIMNIRVVKTESEKALYLSCFYHSGFSTGRYQEVNEDELWSTFSIVVLTKYLTDSESGAEKQLIGICDIDGSNMMFTD